MPSQKKLRLPREPSAPRQARAALAGLVHRLPPERRTAADLLLSELVANAVKYGGDGPVEVELCAEPDRFRAEVVDQGDGFLPLPRDTRDLHRSGGWGLHLVEQLSDRWGAHREPTHVWFEIDGHAAERREPEPAAAAG